ncbi:MAG: hypothetical protein LBU27_04020 [Candidatus Peribacteria bacterium]|jgi:hypothetical protein|nr:hypothetical protein [Candidatus Peribacteria bacterium]
MEQSLRNAIKDMFQEWQNKPFPSAISRTVSARIPTKASDNVLAVI